MGEQVFICLNGLPFEVNNNNNNNNNNILDYIITRRTIIFIIIIDLHKKHNIYKTSSLILNCHPKHVT